MSISIVIRDPGAGAKGRVPHIRPIPGFRERLMCAVSIAGLQFRVPGAGGPLIGLQRRSVQAN